LLSQGTAVVLPARDLVQGAEPVGFEGAGADDEQPGLGVQVAVGPAAADPGVEVNWDMPRWGSVAGSGDSVEG